MSAHLGLSMHVDKDGHTVNSFSKGGASVHGKPEALDHVSIRFDDANPDTAQVSFVLNNEDGHPLNSKLAKDLQKMMGPDAKVDNISAGIGKTVVSADMTPDQAKAIIEELNAHMSQKSFVREKGRMGKPDTVGFEGGLNPEEQRYMDSLANAVSRTMEEGIGQKPLYSIVLETQHHRAEEDRVKLRTLTNTADTKSSIDRIEEDSGGAHKHGPTHIYLKAMELDSPEFNKIIASLQTLDENASPVQMKNGGIKITADASFDDTIETLGQSGHINMKAMPDIHGPMELKPEKPAPIAKTLTPGTIGR